MLKSIGGGEVIVVLVIVLLVFGAAKLPQLARSLGASAKEFRKGVDEGVGDSDSDDADPDDSTV